MHRTRDRSNGLLFDPWASLGAKRRQMLDKSWAGVFRSHLLNALPVRALAGAFSAGMGRPTKDLHVAAGVLILQQLHDLTDAATVEALAFNLAWHYALDVQDEADAYLCEKTLRNYRRLVMDQGLDRVLFQALTDELVQAFGVDVSRQRLDSTGIRSAMRSLTRLGTVVETISKFLRELARTYPGLHAHVDVELVRRYVAREGEGCFADTTPSESKRRLPEAGRDLWQLAKRFESTEARALESFGLLQRVLAEQFEIVEADDASADDAPVRVKEPKEIPCDNLRNPADPDSSYNKHRGQGYLAQVMETYQEDDEQEDEQAQHTAGDTPDLITHVSVGKMNVHDSQYLEPALADVSNRDLKPQQLLADSHYGSTDNVHEAAEEAVELVSPAMTAKGEARGDLTLEQFELDETGRVLRCPAGHTPVLTSHGPQRHQARFDPAVCAACPLRERCPTRTADRRGEGRRLQYTHDRVAQRRRRLNDRSSAFKARYRWRAGIEATMSRLKHQMRLAHLRVRGMPTVTYATFLRALGLNIHRCARCLAG